MRQHVAASTGDSGSNQPVGDGLATTSGMLPASNKRQQQQKQPSKGETSSSVKTPTHLSKLDSSLSALTHAYADRLNLNPLYTPASTSTRKGGSERLLTHKDKSDRATNEQVMDPRTRLVLFKMIGRGLLSKIEGCVSTGKEVCLSVLSM